jgi:hypothetical protein
MNTYEYIHIKQFGKHVMLSSYSIQDKKVYHVSFSKLKWNENVVRGAVKKKDIVVWCFVFMTDGARESGSGFTGFGRLGGASRSIDANS